MNVCIFNITIMFPSLYVKLHLNIWGEMLLCTSSQVVCTFLMCVALGDTHRARQVDIGWLLCVCGRVGGVEERILSSLQIT